MTNQITEIAVPDLDDIEACAKLIEPYIIETPILNWQTSNRDTQADKDSELILKMELFQRTGSFKARAAIYNVLLMSAEQRKAGITTISAGNHAIATAYAAACFGLKSTVIMLANSSPARIAAARAYGAQVIIASDAVSGFEMVEEIRRKNGLHYIHAFEGQQVTTATASCGLELMRTVKDLDAVVVPIGGGGLCSGIAVAVKTLNPDCKIYGVEPTGAAVMSQSFKMGYAF